MDEIGSRVNVVEAKPASEAQIALAHVMALINGMAEN